MSIVLVGCTIKGYEPKPGLYRAKKPKYSILRKDFVPAEMVKN